jgi:hypothetical protein
LALLLGAPSGITAAAPDLTVGTNRFAVDTQYNFNLGPTGLRGWIYRGGTLADTDDMTGHQPWQILVTSVGPNTPASGVLATNDVILGVSTGSGKVPVPFFTNDARKSLGWAIGAAEAGDGVMNLKRWRNGVTQDVAIKLPVLGAYSVTAPYNCPKSALVLSNAIKVLSKRAMDGAPLGLAMLASGDTNFWPRLQTYARSIAPRPGSLDPYQCDTWSWGYNNVFLAEYYLRTGDSAVLNGIREYTIALAKAQSLYGTFGHGGGENHHDGTYHGSIPPYGPVNQCGLAANLAIVLGKKCGVADPEIGPAIERANKFFGYYVQKGTVPYGEHEPWPMHAASNGKNELAAVFFGLQGDRPAQTEYYVRLALAGYEGREIGHTGQGFSYLWSPLAVAVGGPDAVAAYLTEIRWHLDLSRRCDSSFAYDGTGDGANAVKNYWDASDYSGFLDPTVWNVLTYSLPRRALYITGRNPNPANTLSAAAVSNAVWAAKYPQLCAGFTTKELLSHFGEYDPMVRRFAAEELARRPGSTNLVDGLIALTISANARVREAACQALGQINLTNALPALAQRMYDPDVWVRAKANKALEKFGQAALPQLTNMLAAFVAHGTTDSPKIDWSDPIQIGNGYLAGELFQTLASKTYSQSTNLLYPAIRVGLTQPTGMARSCLADFIGRLSWTDVQMLAPSIVATAANRAPAGRMFAADVWYAALRLLGKYRVEEGIPLSLRMNDMQTGQPETFQVLTNAHHGAAWEALPVLYAYQAYWPHWVERECGLGQDTDGGEHGDELGDGDGQWLLV